LQLLCAASSLKHVSVQFPVLLLIVVARSRRGHPARGILRAERNSISIVFLPADGTALPNVENGDFGRSPIYGQLSGKLQFVLISLHGVPNVTHNSGSTR